MWCTGSTDVSNFVSKFNSAASIGVAVLFLLYLIVYSLACPKRDLLVAAGCELLFFVCLAAWRFRRNKTIGAHAKNAVIDQLSEDIRPLGAARNIYQYAFFCVWMIVGFLGVLDFAALCLAFSGNLGASEYLYTNVPTMRLIGAHPAATAEILSGAYVSAGKFQDAEKIYGLIGRVRQSVYGPEGESTVGLNADYGDLYALQRRYREAQPFYEKSIAMSKKIKGATGYGRPLTGLANCFREQGQNDRAEALYVEALKMRTRLYGANSDKVGATLKEYSALLNQIGRKQEAATLSERAHTIDLLQKKEDSNPASILFAMGLIFLASFFLFGRKGIFTKLATERLQSKIQSASEPLPADVKRLAVLYKYQGIKIDSNLAEEFVSRT